MAKIVARLVEQETPSLVLMGKQAVDDDCNQTGQMLAALLGWPQGTFASALGVANGALEVTREVDDGLRILSLNFPAVVTTDLRLNQPRYASLPNIMKAKKKPIDVTSTEILGIDVTPRVKVLKTIEPVVRKAGLKVGSANELVKRLRSETGLL